MIPDKGNTNKRLTIIVLLAFLLLGGMIIPPVAARYQISPDPLSGDMISSPGKVSDFTVDVSQDGDAIRKISVDVGTGTTVNFTLTYGNGATVSGWMEYSNTGFYQQHSEVSIGGDTQGYDYVGLQEIGKIDVVGYARNYTSDTEYTTGFIVYDTTFGITEGRTMAYYSVSSLSDNVVYKFELTASNPVSITYYTDSRENVAKWATSSPIEVVSEWIAMAQSYAVSIKEFIESLFAWLYFFFVENLQMIIALYLAMTMAIAFAGSGNFFKRLSRFFTYQKKLFEFILSLWDILVKIIGTMVQIFVKWL